MARPVAEHSYRMPIALFASHVKRVIAEPERWARGQITWSSSTGAPLLSVDYTVRAGERGQIVVDIRRGATHQICPVELQPWHYDGVRCWWQCPICDRRAAVLFRPPGAAFLWACRPCYKITYQSSNDSGRYRSLFKRLVRLREEPRK
jgi:hypothetical protein